MCIALLALCAFVVAALQAVCKHSKAACPSVQSTVIRRGDVIHTACMDDFEVPAQLWRLSECACVYV